MRLEVKGLSFSFGDKRVLKEITFDVQPGEFVGLMGPNGSGKTTLLRCIMNYLAPPAGSVLVDGIPADEMVAEDIARTFAVVPQSSSTDFTFSAHDIVMMGRLPHRSSRYAGPTMEDAAAVQEAMEWTDTWRYATRRFSALSGGERQRVIIARAIAQRPKALLLDEPTVYLDINGQFEVMDLVKKLNRESGLTVIAVMHDVNLAARYCDTIALLSNGRLEAIGPPSDVLEPETIQSVYGIDVVVRRDPFSQAVYVLPHTTRSAAAKHGRRVHVLCGGGTGGPVMKALADNGYSVSAGALNVLDSDFENAQDLHIPVAAESPFAPISEEVHRENMRLIGQSEAIVLSAFPVGPGNLRNMEAASEALSMGKRVVVFPPESGKTIDFVDGQADAAMKDLISSGAIPVKGIADMLRELQRGR